MAIKPISVSQLNDYIARLIGTDPLLGTVVVRGEISNYRPSRAGYLFFSLKDAQSTIRCFAGSEVADKIRQEIEDGREVICTGYVNVYKPGGYYSLTIRSLDPVGQGDLAAAFEKLKKKLEAEGLFDAAHKQPLPRFPEKIAVVTSPTGAALQDILSILRHRNKSCSVLIYPVLVQGKSAAADIAHALNHINETMDDIDLIICGRGGGSLEDLWAFNEEPVARAVFDSRIPVISAVGHETDFTIADFCADARAETPTAAAQMAVPDTDEVRTYLLQCRRTMEQAIAARIADGEKRLARLHIGVIRRMILQRLDSADYRSAVLAEQLRVQMAETLRRLEDKVEKAGASLQSLSPVHIMEKGYAAVVDEVGRMVRRMTSLKEGDVIRIRGSDGTVRARVIEKARTAQPESPDKAEKR